MTALNPIAAPARLRAGASQTFLSFESRTPFHLDLSWPEESCFGEMLGLGAIRIRAPHPALLRWRLEAGGRSDCTSGPAQPRISVAARVRLPAAGDPLLDALLGDHPLHWMRSLLRGVGLPIWAGFAALTRIPPPELDAILHLWRRLSSGAESALWRCAGEDSSFSALLDWARELDQGMPPSEIDAAVRAALASDPGWASSPEAEWLEASSGFPLPLLHSPAASSRLRNAANVVVRLSNADLTPGRLKALRGMAEERRGLQRLAAKSEATLRLKRLHATELAGLCRLIWRECESALAAAAAESLSLLLQGSGDSWPLDEATRPALLPLCAARPLTLQLALPPLSRRRASRILAALPEARVIPLPGHRLEACFPPPKPRRLPIGAETLVRRVACAPFLAAFREPAGAAVEFACQEIVSPAAGAPSILWRRLLQRYGLPCPEPSSTARLRISIPSAWAEIWPELPHSRDEIFPQVFSSIAETIQQTARCWLPCLALNDPACYRSPRTAVPLLVYAASQPFRTRGKSPFTHDYLSRSGFQLAFNSAASGFPAILREVHAALLASSHRSTRSYSPVRTGTLFRNVYRQRRLYERLLAADALLVEEIIHLADSAAELRTLIHSPKLAAKVLFKSLGAARSGLCQRLRRIYDGRPLEPLFSAICVEATAAACRAMGGEAEVAAVLTIEHEDSVQHFHNAAALGRR